jgi:tRNA threonylcarbamoyladenosine biosynthesis protein TsaB
MGCSVVVASGATVLGVEQDTAIYGQAEKLVPMVASVMRRAGLPASALDMIGVTVGPGSFTGIRVGLAAARGIARVNGARLIGVTGFQAVAASLAKRSPGPGFILIALESRREDLYVQILDHARVAIEDPAATMPEALNDMLDRVIGAAPLLLAGDAAQRAASNLAQRPDTLAAEGSAPNAAGVLQAALCRWPSPAQTAGPMPLYLRPPAVTLSKMGLRLGR